MRQLAEQHFFRAAGNAGLGHHDAGRDGNDQRGNLRHQTVADRQTHIGVGRFHKRHILLQNADQNAGDDVDRRDDQPRDRVAAHEFRRAVHRSVKAGFLRQLVAAFAGFGFIDQPRRQIRVNRHLLAGHRVQRETRGDFGDTAGTFGDDHEVHQNKDREHDHADDEIAAHDKTAERRDDVAGGFGAAVSVRQDQTR